jgi:hypothetical protein
VQAEYPLHRRLPGTIAVLPIRVTERRRGARRSPTIPHSRLYILGSGMLHCAIYRTNLTAPTDYAIVNPPSNLISPALFTNQKSIYKTALNRGQSAKKGRIL